MARLFARGRSGFANQHFDIGIVVLFQLVGRTLKLGGSSNMKRAGSENRRGQKTKGSEGSVDLILPAIEGVS